MAHTREVRHAARRVIRDLVARTRHELARVAESPGDPDALHDARVSARRTRAIAAECDAELDLSLPRRLRRTLRRIQRASGRVRELDVMRAALVAQQAVSAGPEASAAIVQAIGWIDRRRAARTSRLCAQLATADRALERLAHRLAHSSAPADTDEVADRARLVPVIVARWRAHGRWFTRTRPVDAERLHAARLRLKAVRALVTLLHDLPVADRPAIVHLQTLATAWQDRLGAVRDGQERAAVGRRLARRRAGRQLSGLPQVVAQWQQTADAAQAAVIEAWPSAGAHALGMALAAAAQALERSASR